MGDSNLALWGGHSCLQTPLRRLFENRFHSKRGPTEEAARKGGCSQNWPPYKNYGLVENMLEAGHA
jgi:hypothetical protein